jgi:general secretion pathway protein K
MIIVALVATLAGSMVWQQWRAIQVEAAERARAQSAWILSGALDWARLILREDAKSDMTHSPPRDHLGEPWAVPLAEARLSTFLAADKDNTDDAPDAFLSGAITDAMARYNLTNLLDPKTGGIDQRELANLERLCETVGVSKDVASRIAVGLRDAAPPVPPAPGASSPPHPTRRSAAHAAVGFPARLARHRCRIAARARPVHHPHSRHAAIPTSVNVNTAPREVLVAVVDKLDLATAERIVQSRQRVPLKGIGDLTALAPSVPAGNLNRLAFSSNYFQVRGRLRLGDVVLEQRSLVKRNGPTSSSCNANASPRASRPARKPRQSENQYGDFAARSPLSP